MRLIYFYITIHTVLSSLRLVTMSMVGQSNSLQAYWSDDVGVGMASGRL